MIFFTGASGFIGSHFHEALDGSEIINYDLKDPIFKYSSKLIKGNVRDFDSLNSAIKESNCDTIIALAAEHKDFGISENEYFLTNEMGTENICKAANNAGIKKIIFYSSVAVYGANKIPSDENMTPNPNLPYGKSKLAGEKVLEKWYNEDPTRCVIIIRPTVVYGERNVANMFRLIMQIKAGRFFNIGKGDNVKSLAYCKNLVEATLFLNNKINEGYSIFNYSDSPQLTSKEITQIISEKLGMKPPISLPYWFLYLLGLPFDLLIKITGKDLPISTNRIDKLRTQTFHQASKINEFGFAPKFNNKEGIERMVDWMKNEYKENINYFDV
jgi:nucleoside-diphosphate-sugar epimerase